MNAPKKYAFKILQPKEIKSVLEIIDPTVHVNIDMIEKPDGEAMQKMLRVCVAYRMGSKEEFLLKHRREMEKRGKPPTDVYNNKTDLQYVFHMVRAICNAIDISDFSLADLVRPSRSRILLSGVINYLRFCDSKGPQMKQRAEERLEAQAQLDQEVANNDALGQHVATLRESLRKAREEARQIEKAIQEAEGRYLAIEADCLGIVKMAEASAEEKKQLEEKVERARARTKAIKEEQKSKEDQRAVVPKDLLEKRDQIKVQKEENLKKMTQAKADMLEAQSQIQAEKMFSKTQEDVFAHAEQLERKWQHHMEFSEQQAEETRKGAELSDMLQSGRAEVQAKRNDVAAAESALQAKKEEVQEKLKALKEQFAEVMAMQDKRQEEMGKEHRERNARNKLRKEMETDYQAALQGHDEAMIKLQEQLVGVDKEMLELAGVQRDYAARLKRMFTKGAAEAPAAAQTAGQGSPPRRTLRSPSRMRSPSRVTANPQMFHDFAAPRSPYGGC